ncbi:MAG: hypothetical protein A3K03_06765 [Bdellovibrionales bacterium RIFOXYD1_FULL_44_7]|nr:MAG: hypothetical protein A3K03_06765 [Bdellovibrionales bacterium RIFOXYD1_FULL_44_7]
MAKKAYSPIIYSYLRKYQEDPTSRIFAPLAEAYRKAGLIDEAIEIAREGLRVHPQFVGGRVALARALFDNKLYSEVMNELAPIIAEVPDNLVAQRLLAESYLMLGRVIEALGCYKMLLYFNPNDTETAQIVQELENQAYSKGSMVLRTDPQPDPSEEFIIGPANNAIEQDPQEKRSKIIRKIVFLQGLLQKIERYKIQVSSLA